MTSNQSDYLYFECPVCEFSIIEHAKVAIAVFCPLCASDSGHEVAMLSREATSDDHAEGTDARPSEMRP